MKRLVSSYTPPTIDPPERPLGVLASLRAMRNNVLSIIPAIAYTQEIVSGVTGPGRWHMVQGPEGLRRVFLDNADNYPKSEVMIRMLRPAVGKSLFTSEGDEWRWQRRAIAPVFTARNVKSLAPVMTQTAERVSARISANPQAVEMVSQMLSATFDVICDVALSGREHFDSDKYGRAITRYFQTVGRASLLDFLDVPHWFPRPGELFGRASVRTMHRMVSEAINARRRHDPGEMRDLLDHMLLAEDPETGRRMSQKDLLHNMQFFIVAGHETTALTLAWALFLLSQDQEAQHTAREEARALLGERPAGADDVEKAPFINQVLQEAMRLYPPVGMVARNVLSKDNLYGRDILARDTVFINIYGLHRHHLFWEKPDVFDPTNFSQQNVANHDRFLYLPFGAGPRVCVGASFAMMQAKIILTTLLARFCFTPAGPNPTPVMHMTIRPEPGITLSAKPING